MISLLMLLAANNVFVTGNELYGQCTGTSEEQLICLSYITGVADGMTVTQVVYEPSPGFACIPDGVNRQQVRDIVVKYMTNNPESRHMHAGAVIIVALKNAFPCK